MNHAFIEISITDDVKYRLKYKILWTVQFVLFLSLVSMIKYQQILTNLQ